jgi:hypothetical protein
VKIIVIMSSVELQFFHEIPESRICGCCHFYGKFDEDISHVFENTEK